MPALNTESITISSTIEPNSHTPALIRASSLMLVGFTLTSCLCQNDFVVEFANELLCSWATLQDTSFLRRR